MQNAGSDECRQSRSLRHWFVGRLCQRAALCERVVALYCNARFPHFCMVPDRLWRADSSDRVWRSENAFRTNEARPAIRNASIHFRSLISPSTFSSLALIRNSSSRRSPLVATSADACDSNTASVSTFACSSLKPAPLSRRTNLCVSNVAANDMRGCSLLKSIFYPSRQRCTRSYFINGCEAVIAENDFYVYCPVPGRFLNSVVWRRSCASSAFSSGVRVGWRVRASQRARSAL